MKIRHNEIEINEKAPFANCKLDRKRYAQILSDIVSTYADGFVLAINNECKATLLQRFRLKFFIG